MVLAKMYIVYVYICQCSSWRNHMNTEESAPAHWWERTRYL